MPARLMLLMVTLSMNFGFPKFGTETTRMTKNRMTATQTIAIRSLKLKRDRRCGFLWGAGLRVLLPDAECLRGAGSLCGGRDAGCAPEGCPLRDCRGSGYGREPLDRCGGLPCGGRCPDGRG